MRPKEHTGSFQRIEDKEEKGKKLRRTVTGDGISKKERRNSVLLDIVSPRSLNSGDALGTLSKSADVSPRRRREMSPTKYNELLFKSNEFDVHKIKKLSGGTGSGCSVYKAKINGWRCCVKELVKKDSTNFEQDMFRRELTVMRTIESRNVCQYLGYNDDDEGERERALFVQDFSPLLFLSFSQSCKWCCLSMTGLSKTLSCLVKMYPSK